MCLGIPGRVTSVREDRGIAMGVVDFGGVTRECCLEYVRSEVREGDYVIVHVGFAISRVDESEARRTYDILREMSRLDELEWMAPVADAALAGLAAPPVPAPPVVPA